MAPLSKPHFYLGNVARGVGSTHALTPFTVPGATLVLHALWIQELTK